MEITKEIWFDYWHRITFHDSACRNAHGHRWIAFITLEGDVIEKQHDSSTGMVMDFKYIKKIAKTFIDNKLDHWFLWYEWDEIMKKFYTDNPDMKNLKCSFMPTAENIAKWLFEQLETLFIDTYWNNLRLKEIKLYETPTSYVIYTK